MAWLDFTLVGRAQSCLPVQGRVQLWMPAMARLRQTEDKQPCPVDQPSWSVCS